MPSFLHRYPSHRTSPTKLRQIPQWLTAIVEVQSRARFGRDGVAFAWPTRTVYLEQEPAAEPA
jgi:hypothetical protein